MKCKDCKPKQMPIFPLWSDKAKYWSSEKKAASLKRLCCAINSDSTQPLTGPKTKKRPSRDKGVAKTIGIYAF